MSQACPSGRLTPPVAGLSGIQLGVLASGPLPPPIPPHPSGRSWQQFGGGQPGTLFRALTQSRERTGEGGNDSTELGCRCASFTPSVNAVESVLLPDWGWSRGSSWGSRPDLTWEPRAWLSHLRAFEHAVPELGGAFPPLLGQLPPTLQTWDLP